MLKGGTGLLALTGATATAVKGGTAVTGITPPTGTAAGVEPASLLRPVVTGGFSVGTGVEVPDESDTSTGEAAATAAALTAGTTMAACAAAADADSGGRTTAGSGVELDSDCARVTGCTLLSDLVPTVTRLALLTGDCTVVSSGFG